MMFFLENDRGSQVYRCKKEFQRTFVKCEFQDHKKSKTDLKTFFTKFEYGQQKNAEFYADFETVEKNAKNLLAKKLQARKVCKI